MVVLYIHYDLVLNNNIWQNKKISFEYYYVMFCSLSAKKKNEDNNNKKKLDKKRNENKFVFIKIMFDNNL